MEIPACISGIKYENLHNNKKRGDLTKISYDFFSGILKGYLEILYGRNVDDVIEDFLEKSHFRLKTFLDAVNLALYERIEQDLNWNPMKEVEIFLEESLKNAPLENLNNQIHIVLAKRGLEIKKPFIKNPRSDISCLVALMHSLVFYRKFYLEVNRCATYNKMDFQGKAKAFLVVKKFLAELDGVRPKHNQLISMFKEIVSLILNNDESCKVHVNRYIFGVIKTIRESHNITTYINNYNNRS